jgi:hypothetical protein
MSGNGRGGESARGRRIIAVWVRLIPEDDEDAFPVEVEEGKTIYELKCAINNTRTDINVRV